MLYAYIIQGGRWELTAGTGRHGGFAADTVFPLLLKSLAMIRCPRNQVKKAHCGAAVHREAAPPRSVALLQGSFQRMEPDGEQRTQQGLGTAMYCSAHRSATHTHSFPYSLCL